MRVSEQAVERVSEHLEAILGSFKPPISFPFALRFFYWRLRRLLLEDSVKKLIHKTGAQLPDGTVSSMLRRWLVEDKGAVNAFIFEDNRVCHLLSSSVILCHRLSSNER